VPLDRGLFGFVWAPIGRGFYCLVYVQ